MDIVIVEDDYFQADWLETELQKAFPEASIDPIKTELQFREHLDDLVANPPDLIIMDIMLRWTDPSPKVIPQPPDIEKEGFYRAGIRCQRLLQENEKTRHIPLVLYTILGKGDLKIDLEDLPMHIVHLAKTGDADAITEAIRSLLRRA